MELLDVQKEADSAGRKAALFCALAVLIAGAFGFFLARYGGSSADTQQVVVAARQIPALTQLKATDLLVVSWPRESLPDGTLSDPNTIINAHKINNNELSRNEPILSAHLSNADNGLGISVLISNDKRAFVVQVNEPMATAMLLHPGANVDVVATIGDPRTQSFVSRTVLQNIKVLAIGDRVDVEPVPLQTKEGESRPSDQAATDRRRVVTLAVSLEEAEILSYATSQGRVDLVLRANGDTDIAVTSGVTTEKMLGALKKDVGHAAPPPPTPTPHEHPRRSGHNSGPVIYHGR